MTASEVHGLAGRLLRDFQHDALSERQDWLLSACLSELEYRRRRAIERGRSLDACHCALCFVPRVAAPDER